MNAALLDFMLSFENFLNFVNAQISAGTQSGGNTYFQILLRKKYISFKRRWYFLKTFASLNPYQDSKDGRTVGTVITRT